MSDTRTATVHRATGETDVRATIVLEGAGRAAVQTGVAFLDHMLSALAVHGGFDIDLTCSGDLQVDDHHTVEDCAIVLGRAFDEALGPRQGIRRFGYAYAPLDEALARAVIDLSGRGFCRCELQLRRERVGELACENVPHFFRSLATAMRATLHIDVLAGENDHHRIEASFKALALALREAVEVGGKAIPSTKGVL